MEQENFKGAMVQDGDALPFGMERKDVFYTKNGINGQ